MVKIIFFYLSLSINLKCKFKYDELKLSKSKKSNKVKRVGKETINSSCLSYSKILTNLI